MEEDKRNIFDELISEIERNNSSSSPLIDKYIFLKYVLERVCKDVTKEDQIQFSSLFSRIVFVCKKYNVPRVLERELQNIRIKYNFLIRDKKNVVPQKQYASSLKALTFFLSVIYLGRRSENFSIDRENVSESVELHEKIRAEVIEIDRDKRLIICVSDSLIGDELKVKYDVKNINDIFNETIDNLWIGAQINLIDCIIDKHSQYLIPHYIVLEPDYLTDASALAECFQNYGNSHLHYFRKKFEQSANSQYILLGNLANFFLDELVYAENANDLEFEEVFQKSFRLFPFEYTSCNDIAKKTDFKDFMKKARNQFNNIKRVIINDFPTNQINVKLCTLEPAFYCEKFGFQGRLDLLQLPKKGSGTANIIELKSGGLPFPKDNPGKIAPNHEAQTNIYRMIIQSVFGLESRQISSSILYSSSDVSGENLRFSAPYKKLEKEIVNVRNLIVGTEHSLSVGNDETVWYIFDQLFDLENYNRVPKFFTDKLLSIKKILEELSSIEKKYFFQFIRFISTELYLQKIGDEGFETQSGVSALWTSEFAERKESFNLLAGLEIMEIKESETDMKICFSFSDDDMPFSNFREGEICILYPKDNDVETILTNQILKGTVAEINSDNIIVRFRYKQKNKEYLTSHKNWVIEHDKLDHTYNNMYKSLYSFISEPKIKRDLLLGLSCPKYSDIQCYIKKTDQLVLYKQRHIIDKVLAAKDYFLLVGPPGTGKTSIYVKLILEELYKNSDNNILLIAYTNRAVDELCDVVSGLIGSENFIRVGSELSCNPSYRNRLLQNIAKNIYTREQLKKIISEQRIFIGTLASIVGKPELFDIKKFDLAIIDEASQILEPQIIGLLPKFDKFIMIGDHNQLSTITLQNELKSKVSDADLNNIELMDCRESYFERMFRICKKNNWTHAYDILTYQGRMHSDIADFPNRYFYNNKLLPANEWQTQPLAPLLHDANNIYQHITVNERIAFISYEPDLLISLNDKINETEANITVNIIKSIHKLYKLNNLPFDEKTIGVITPYRNQIALIKHKLRISEVKELENIMVDSVERFQGSQRDIIILSFCMNKKYQLDFFCNLNRERNVDRKLNVALTRARKHLFIVGNKNVVQENAIYNEFIKSIPVFYV